MLPEDFYTTDMADWRFKVMHPLPPALEVRNVMSFAVYKYLLFFCEKIDH